MIGSPTIGRDYDGRMPLPFDPIQEARRQWTDHGWGEVDTMAAATSITRANQIVLGRINEVLATFGLTFSRFEALVLLGLTRAGALTMGKMGERLMVHPTSVTNTIDRLERDGLVRRVAHPQDRRTTLAEITDEGRARAKEALDALVEARFGMGALGAAELDDLESAIRALRRDADDFDEE